MLLHSNSQTLSPTSSQSNTTSGSTTDTLPQYSKITKDTDLRPKKKKSQTPFIGVSTAPKENVRPLDTAESEGSIFCRLFFLVYSKRSNTIYQIHERTNKPTKRQCAIKKKYIGYKNVTSRHTFSVSFMRPISTQIIATTIIHVRNATKGS